MHRANDLAPAGPCPNDHRGELPFDQRAARPRIRACIGSHMCRNDMRGKIEPTIHSRDYLTAAEAAKSIERIAHFGTPVLARTPVIPRPPVIARSPFRPRITRIAVLAPIHTGSPFDLRPSITLPLFLTTHCRLPCGNVD